VPRLTARHVQGDRFEVAVRGHRLVVDQPAPDGDDEGPTPVELFTASLAACVAVLARRYLARHGLPVDGLAVVAEHDLSRSPARVGAVRLVLEVPADLPPHRRRGLVAVASHCTVHATLRTPPDVTITLSAPSSDESADASEESPA
jgi:putative redox protein